MKQTIQTEPTTNNASQTGANQGDDAVEEIVQDLLQTGRAWASHGLLVGKGALENSARALDITADTLAKLAKRFGPTATATADRETDDSETDDSETDDKAA